MDLDTCPGKKSLSVTSQEKKLFVFAQGKNNVLFSCWEEKNNLVRKKNHTLPPGIKWSAPYKRRCLSVVCLSSVGPTVTLRFRAI